MGLGNTLRRESEVEKSNILNTQIDIKNMYVYYYEKKNNSVDELQKWYQQ